MGEKWQTHHRLLNNLHVMYIRDLIDCLLEKFKVKRIKCKESVEEINGFFWGGGCLVFLKHEI